MPFEFVLPKPGAYKKATKDLIVSILAREHPLTLKQILQRMRRQYGVSVSYQAVRKSARALADDKVLSAKGREYEISKGWISEAHAFIDELSKAYLAEWKPMRKMEVGEDVIVYTLDSIYDAERLWGDLLFDWVRKNATASSQNTFQATHIWTILFHLEWEEKQILALQKKTKNRKAVIYSDTFLDKVAQKFYSTYIPTKMVRDATWTRGCSIGTYDDMIIQLYQPKGLAKEVDDFYRGVKRLEDVDLARMSEIAKRKAEVKLTVIKNPEMARQIRESCLRHF